MRLLPPITPSRALDRVAAAFARQAAAWPDDLDIVQVVGRRDAIARQVAKIKAAGRRYAVIQYVLRSSQKPHTSDWIDIWRGAVVVWSYLDLPALCAADGVAPDFRCYHAPLGLDPDVNDPDALEIRRPIVLAFGSSWLSEGAREVHAAADMGDMRAMQIGRFRGRPTREQLGPVPDMQLSAIYRQVQYVAALRRIEGFELPAVEGLCSGARPILFDRPHYRKWFGGWADYIHELDRDAVTMQLVSLFQGPYRAVTTHEATAASCFFSWPRILDGFWQACAAC